MTIVAMNRLSLNRPATYQIKLPWKMDVGRAGWAGELAVALDDDPPVTILTGELD